jgi:hypothetical protein
MPTPEIATIPKATANDGPRTDFNVNKVAMTLPLNWL